MEEACIQEIHRLHDEFVKWFTASIPNTEDNFAPIASALSKDFHMVPPKGVLVSQPDLTNSLRNAYGCRKGSPFRIEIKNCKLLCDETKNRNQDGSKGGLCVINYEEWQYLGDKEESGRISTVVFRCNGRSSSENVDTKERNITWLNVHETWINGKEPKM